MVKLSRKKKRQMLPPITMRDHGSAEVVSERKKVTVPIPVRARSKRKFVTWSGQRTTGEGR